jgi:uncharacterized phage protein (TIGR01671 family)
MSREIKFRGWIGRYKRFAEFVEVHSDGSWNYDIKVGGNFEYGVDEERDHLTQFTGLTDKNGKDIYEGDIIMFTYWWFDGNECESNLTGTIVYSDHSMSYQLKGVKNKEWESHTGYHNDSEYLTPFSELNFDQADFEVIGNIYEHGHLLKG